MKKTELSRCCLITPSPCLAGLRSFLARLDYVLESGINLVQLRAKDITPEAFDEIAKAVLSLCQRYNAPLILNGPDAIRPQTQADGIHLSSAHLMALDRRATDPTLLLSAACHNAEQLAHAEKIGVDFVMLSPVLFTNSHPKAIPLGWDKFSHLTSTVSIPIYALGGMSPRLLALARSNGAYGVAGISGFWAAGGDR